jgi:hypothetical protein
MNDAKNTLRSRNSIAHVMVVDDAEDSVVNMFVDKLGTHYLHTVPTLHAVCCTFMPEFISVIKCCVFFLSK